MKQVWGEACGLPVCRRRRRQARFSLHDGKKNASEVSKAPAYFHYKVTPTIFAACQGFGCRRDPLAGGAFQAAVPWARGAHGPAPRVGRQGAPVPRRATREKGETRATPGVQKMSVYAGPPSRIFPCPSLSLSLPSPVRRPSPAIMLSRLATAAARVRAPAATRKRRR